MNTSYKYLIALALTSAYTISTFAQDATSDDGAAAVQSEKTVKPKWNYPTKDINGRVVDAATGAPVAGIRVQGYNDNSHSAMTDENGEYTLTVPLYVTSVILEAEGYNLLQQAVNPAGNQPVARLYSDKFTDIYATSTTATNKKTADVSYTNNDLSIDNQIQSSLGADIYSVMRRGGSIAEGVRMYIQGLNSLNSNAQPLVVIDGVITPMQYDVSSLHDGFFNNMLSNIMVEDIERISVLKNGLAIYGAKGANGVIVIETKRNKSMKTRIDLSVAGTYELVPKTPEMMNAEQFRVYASELIGTTGTKKNSYKFLQTDPNYYYYNMYHNETDWHSLVSDEAFTQNYSLNVQGGDEVANYNLSVGFANGESTLRNTDFQRFNLRLNSDIILTNDIDVRFDASYSDVTRNMRDDGAQYQYASQGGNYGIISSPSFLSLIKSPFLSPYAYDTNGNISHYLSDADDYLSDVLQRDKWRTSLANPLSILENAEGDNKNNFGNRIISLAITPQWRINRYWTLFEHFSFYLSNTDENYYLPLKGVPQYEVEDIGVVPNRASSLASRDVNIASDTYITFQRRFAGGHFLNARGGVRYINRNFNLNSQTGYRSANDKTPNMSASLLNKTTDGVEDKSIDINYYLTGDYNYLERYYLSAGISMNGDSKFGVDAADGVKIGNYAWGFFPSVQAAWVMSNERWFRAKGVDYLRLNVGFDLLGNDDMDSNANRTYFVSHRVFNKVGGLTIGNIGNTRLQWETTARLTAGLQLAAFNNRLHFGFNYFRGNTYNILALNSLSYLTGLEYNWNNSGRITNEGFDLTARVKVLNHKDWQWEAGFSMGHYKNRIERLSNGEDNIKTSIYDATIISQVGKASNLFYGYRTDGVFCTTAEADAAALYQLKSNGQKQYFAAGDMKFVDVDNNHEINENDMQVIGDPNPDIYGTIFSTLCYKDFTLSLNFKYSLGNDLYNYQRSVLEAGNNFYNQTTAVLRRWTHEGQQTDMPRAAYMDVMTNSRFSDRWIEDGSYLKLANVTLSYDLPIRNTYIQGLTVWGSANNLFTITKYLGGDPEFAASNSVIGMGIDRGLVGAGRNFSLGLRLHL